MSFGRTLTLATGARIPQIGLGTWLSKPREVENAVGITVDCSRKRSEHPFRSKLP